MGHWSGLKDLFYDPSRKIKIKPPQVFDPLFDSLTLDHLRELAQHMKIKASLEWDDQRLRTAILGNLKSSYHNYVVGRMSDVPPYKNILLNLCSELEIPDLSPNATTDSLEERIIQRVFAQCLDNLSQTEMTQLEKTIKVHMKDQYWSNAKRPLMMLSGMAAGRMSGVGLYVAASSGLAAVGKGVGAGAALSGATAMSTALSTLLGPVGLGVVGATAFFQLTKPSHTFCHSLYTSH